MAKMNLGGWKSFFLNATSRFPASHAYVAVAERIKSPLDGEYYLVQNDFVLWIRKEFISSTGSHKCFFLLRDFHIFKIASVG